MTFVTWHKVRFSHVDPAGIVFYPRYFEMLNAAVEEFFAEVAGTDFRTMHLGEGYGVPIVKLETRFVAPSRLGDLLAFWLDATHVGRSSLALAVQVRGEDLLRLEAQIVLVCMDLNSGRPLAWPDTMRARMSASLA